MACTQYSLSGKLSSGLGWVIAVYLCTCVQWTGSWLCVQGKSRRPGQSGVHQALSCHDWAASERVQRCGMSRDQGLE